MPLEMIVEAAVLALLVACGYVGVKTYVRLRRPNLAPYFLRRRLTVMAFLILLIAGAKIFEDVLSGESRVLDERLLLFVHNQVPAALTSFFNAVTILGSAVVVLPVAALAVICFTVVKRRFEAILVMASVAAGAALVIAIKAAAGRVRPALWDTQWYWGSSFPSGHTVHTAALSTALALCAARQWPRYAPLALSAALGWTGLVALSRLVLGVHWPTDVLAAICLGSFVPLTIHIAMELRFELAHRTGVT